MSLMKSTLPLLLAASIVLVTGTASQAQSRGTTHHHSNHSGMNQGGMGTSQMQNSVQSAQNQARMIASRQHQIWLANRMKKNAAERAAGIKTAEGSAAKATADKPTSSTTAKHTTPATK